MPVVPVIHKLYLVFEFRSVQIWNERFPGFYVDQIAADLSEQVCAISISEQRVQLGWFLSFLYLLNSSQISKYLTLRESALSEQSLGVILLCLQFDRRRGLGIYSLHCHVLISALTLCSYLLRLWSSFRYYKYFTTINTSLLAMLLFLISENDQNIGSIFKKRFYHTPASKQFVVYAYQISLRQSQWFELCFDRSISQSVSHLLKCYLCQGILAQPFFRAKSSFLDCLV